MRADPWDPRHLEWAGPHLASPAHCQVSLPEPTELLLLTITRWSCV